MEDFKKYIISKKKTKQLKKFVENINRLNENVLFNPLSNRLIKKYTKNNTFTRSYKKLRNDDDFKMFNKNIKNIKELKDKSIFFNDVNDKKYLLTFKVVLYRTDGKKLEPKVAYNVGLNMTQARMVKKDFKFNKHYPFVISFLNKMSKYGLLKSVELKLNQQQMLYYDSVKIFKSQKRIIKPKKIIIKQEQILASQIAPIISSHLVNYTNKLNIDLDYVETSTDKNSCLYNIINNNILPSIQKRNHHKKELKEILLDFGIKYHKDFNPLTLNDITKLSNKFKFSVRCFNLFGHTIFSNIFKNPRAKVLNFVYSHNHSYYIDNNTSRTLIKKKSQSVDNIVKLYKPTNYYKFRNIDDEDINFGYIKSYDDIKNFYDKGKYTLFYSYDLEDILKGFIKDNILPVVAVICGKVQGIYFHLNKKTQLKIINNIAGNPVDTNTNLITSKNMLNYVKAEKMIYEEIINKSNISSFSKLTYDILCECKNSPLVGSFRKHNITKCNNIDINKCYTNALMKINKIPIFNEFDTFVKGGTQNIEPLTLYLCECNECNIFVKKQNQLYFGFKLMRMNKDKYKILYHLKPSRIKQVNFKDIIMKVYKTDLQNIKLNKFIVNKITGLLEQRYNYNTKNLIFKNVDEAYYYNEIYGGEIYQHFMDDLHLLHISTKSNLYENFIPLKLMIYDYVDIILRKMTSKCIKNNIRIIGYKTDCIYTTATKNQVSKVFNINNNIGGCKFELDKSPVDNVIELNINNIFNRSLPIIIPSSHILQKEIKINDEYNMEEFKAIVKYKHKLLILADYAGSGKSTICKKMTGKTLFVAPVNTLVMSIRKDGIDAITINKLLGMGITDDDRVKKYDISEYDNIVFDEIFMYPLYTLSKINYFMKQNKDKNILATGDKNQLKAIGDNLYNNINDYEQYKDRAIKRMFKYYVNLKIIKRLKSDDDVKRMIKYKEELFNPNNKPIDIVKKYFKVIKLGDMKTTKNISFLRETKRLVNKFVFDKEGIDKSSCFKSGCKYFYKNQVVRCIKYLKKCKIFLNYEYIIKDIDNDNVLIFEELEKEEFKIPLKYFHLYFSYNYCFTNHSIQGITINEPITIFDLKHKLVNRNWVYVATTRNVNMNDIKICLLETEREQIDISHKIRSYKSQDKKRGMKWDKNHYITNSWINNQLKYNTSCESCFNTFTKDNLTIDRLYNNRPHTKNNCRLLCFNCNISKK